MHGQIRGLCEDPVAPHPVRQLSLSWRGAAARGAGRLPVDFTVHPSPPSPSAQFPRLSVFTFLSLGS